MIAANCGFARIGVLFCYAELTMSVRVRWTRHPEGDVRVLKARMMGALSRITSCTGVDNRGPRDVTIVSR